MIHACISVKVSSEHPSAVETMPSSWVATKCPLCGEHRQYLSTEIFQDGVSYLAVKKPVRPVTRSTTSDPDIHRR